MQGVQVLSEVCSTHSDGKATENALSPIVHVARTTRSPLSNARCEDRAEMMLPGSSIIPRCMTACGRVVYCQPEDIVCSRLLL